MNIILLQDIDKVGEKYEVVTVKDGFARNLLIPTKKSGYR
jgi:ribosomal protein L9